MHKRNISVAALAWAMILAALLQAWPPLTHSKLFDWLYFPSVFLAVMLSWNTHSPPEWAGWISFLAYTVSYLGLVFVLYALILELYYLRSVLIHLGEEDAAEKKSPPNVTGTLRRIGQAVSAAERLRRGHWFLKNIDPIHLQESPLLVGARAIVHASDERLVAGLLKKVEAKAKASIGPKEAKDFMEKLRKEAEQTVVNNPAPESDKSKRQAPPPPEAGSLEA